MNIEKVNIEKSENGEITIYTAKGLDKLYPKKAEDIIGAINTPMEYLTKRHDKDDVDKTQSHIKFSYEDSKIILVLNEYDHYSPVITGKMIKTEILGKLNINNGYGWKCFELAAFFRLNRTIFQDKKVCSDLVTKLNNFESTVKKEADLKTDNRANYDLHKKQAVETNLPDSFMLHLSVFKGLPKKMIEVEVDISPESLDCVLISPDLADFIEGIVEETINKQLEEIKKLCPELPIIEI